MRSIAVDTSRFDWKDDRPIRKRLERTIIYEMHVGGFTRHPSSGVAAALRGTFAGLVEKIPYLQALGVNAVELLPVYQFDPGDAPANLTNYWGYSPIGFFAPHDGYASSDAPAAVVDEFRSMVKALHKAGIAVYLDVVYNHTTENGADGPTLFLCDGDTPGIELERVMNTMDRNYVEGHGVVRFDNLRLPASAVLGEVGQALRYAQLRLAPARLTHCMRWLGAASRAQSIAIEHARTRTGFGKTLGEHQGVSFMIADNEIALQQCRLAIWWACWTLDGGAKGRHESSMVKAYVSEELFKVADRCVQILGGMGISDETPVGMIFSDMRAFRLYDGPTEVHKYAIARQVLRNPS